MRKARWADVPSMVTIIERRRAVYETCQPVFWKRAANASAKTKLFYRWLLLRRSAIMLVADRGSEVVGFLIATRARVPPVYDPGGPSMLIDDFAVAEADDWPIVGRALLDGFQSRGRALGCRQVVVVCGAEDAAKTEFLRSTGLRMASTWRAGVV